MQIEGGRFLVTGGVSLIGSRIAARLLASGAAHVTLLDSLSLVSLSGLEDLLLDDRVVLARADVLPWASSRTCASRSTGSSLSPAC